MDEKDKEIEQLRQQVDDLLLACRYDRETIRLLEQQRDEAQAEAKRLQTIAEALVEEIGNDDTETN